MNRNYLGLIGCLIFANTTLADEGRNDAFLLAVNQNLIHSTIAGAWESDCVIDAKLSSSYSARYEFFDDSLAKLKITSFSDTNCASVVDIKKTEGLLSLEGLFIDALGRYIYKVAISSEDGGIYRTSMSFDTHDQLTEIQTDTPSKQLVMHSAQSGR
jgi:hypothetical protein